MGAVVRMEQKLQETYPKEYATRSKEFLMCGMADTYRLMKLTRHFPNDALWKSVRKVEDQ